MSSPMRAHRLTEDEDRHLLQLVRRDVHNELGRLPSNQARKEVGIVEIVPVARVVAGALVAGAAALASGRLAAASVAALGSLRESIPGNLGTDTLPEDLTPGLLALSDAELWNVLFLAQTVLEGIAGHGDVRVVRRGGGGRHPVDAVRHLTDSAVSPPAAHASTGDDRADLVLANRSPRQADAVLAVARHLLADRERTLGPEHPETLASRTNLACLYHAAGRADEAIEEMERVVADRRRTWGAEDQDTRAAEATLDGWRHG